MTARTSVNAAAPRRGSLFIHLFGPVIAVTDGVMHAAEPPLPRLRRGQRPPRKTVDTACGRKRAQLFGIPVVASDGTERGAITRLWPPHIKAAREAGYERCRECFQAKPGRPVPFVTDEERATGIQTLEPGGAA